MDIICAMSFAERKYQSARVDAEELYDAIDALAAEVIRLRAVISSPPTPTSPLAAILQITEASRS